MMVAIVDGQGGGVGKALVERLRSRDADVFIRVLGCNAIATAAMLKAGANEGATGENAIVTSVGDADVVAGPMGIVLANSMLGEMSPRMAASVAQCKARVVLVPVQRCNTRVAGVAQQPLGALIENAVDLILAETE